MRLVNLDIDKITLLQARNCLEAKEMLQRAEMRTATWDGIRRRGTAKPLTAGKLARALGVDVTEIIKS